MVIRTAKFALLLCLTAYVSQANIISLDSSTTLLDSSLFIAGTNYAAVFQLTGGGSADTSVMLSLFDLGGGAGIDQSIGDPVSGDYLVGPDSSLASGIWQSSGTLQLDVDPVNSYALYSQEFAAGSVFSFDFQLLTDLAPGGVPDEFDFQLYDPTYSTLLYDVALDATPVAAPEPASWQLAALCCAALAAHRIGGKR